MFSRRSSLSPIIAGVPLVLLAVAGCESVPQQLDPPEPKDDFGAELDMREINAETVGETQMLHRRTQLEVKALVAIPTGFFEDNSFDVGYGGGLKASIETKKNFYIGVSFDYVYMEQGDGVSSVNDPTGLSDIEPDQLYDQLDRYSFLVTGDYDWTLAKSFLAEKAPLLLRLGGGLGAIVVDGEIDSFVKDQAEAAGSSVDTVPFVGFLGRLALGLRWQFHPHMIVFAEAGYDFVAPFEIEIEAGGTRATVEGDIDFGTINLGAGLTFEF
jgi:opacity protein-like surface antigen